MAECVEETTKDVFDLPGLLYTDPNCPVCYEEYHGNPKVLPCFHTICFSCLDTILDNARLQGRKFRCPTCRHSAKVPDGGTDDFHDISGLQKFIGAKPEEKSSSEMKTSHNRSGWCLVHNRRVVMLCEECQCIGCYACIPIHYFHKMHPFQTSESIVRQAVENALATARETHSKLLALKTDLIREWREGLSASISQARSNIDSEEARLLVQVRSDADVLRRTVTELEEKIASSIDHAMTCIERKLQPLETFEKECEDDLNNGTDDVILSRYTNLPSTTENLNKFVECEAAIESVAWKSFSPEQFLPYGITPNLAGKIVITNFGNRMVQTASDGYNPKSSKGIVIYL